MRSQPLKDLGENTLGRGNSRLHGSRASTIWYVWKAKNEGEECTKCGQWGRWSLSMRHRTSAGVWVRSHWDPKPWEGVLLCVRLTFQKDDSNHVGEKLLERGKKQVGGPVRRLLSNPAEETQWLWLEFKWCQWGEVVRFGIHFQNKPGKTGWISVNCCIKNDSSVWAPERGCDSSAVH